MCILQLAITQVLHLNGVDTPAARAQTHAHPPFMVASGCGGARRRSMSRPSGVVPSCSQVALGSRCPSSRGPPGVPPLAHERTHAHAPSPATPSTTPPPFGAGAAGAPPTLRRRSPPARSGGRRPAGLGHPAPGARRRCPGHGGGRLVHTLYEVIKAEATGFAVASRIYGVSAVALYEAIVPGTRHHRSLVGQLNRLTAVPQPRRRCRITGPPSLTPRWPTIRGLFPALQPRRADHHDCRAAVGDPVPSRGGGHLPALCRARPAGRRGDSRVGCHGRVCGRQQLSL